MLPVKRVLFLCPDFEYNGPGYNALTLARAFRPLGVECLTMAPRGGEREGAFRSSDLALAVDPHLGGRVFGRQSRRQVQAFAPQVLHAQDPTVARRGLSLARRLSVPLVVTINRPPAADEKGAWNEKGAAYIAVSDAVQMHTIQARLVAREAITVIHNGVDLSNYPLPEERSAVWGPTNRRGGRRSAIPVVGALGTLVPHKGQRVFLQAAALLHGKRPAVEYVIIGRGPDLVPLRELAVSLGISKRVTFSSGALSTTAYAVKRPSVQAEAVFLREFDIFVEPSTQEGLGLSVLQAMAWERPVVASGVGGLYDLVEDGVTGILVPKENPEAFAQAIEGLLADPARAAEMGARGRERIAREFNIKDVAQGHLSLYQRLGQGLPVGGGEP
ncbi:MAG: glycosyltransferase family 4 protein [Planctomycetota bacterium]